MLALLYHHVIPSVNILADDIFVSHNINTISVALTNFILVFVLVIIHKFINSMDIKLNIIFEDLNFERNKLQERNQIIEKDLKLEQRIQKQLIPQKNLYLFIDVLYKPMEAVGGDFYDFISFRETNTVGIFISDVSGHGAHAAFITSMIKTLILQAGSARNNPAQFFKLYQRYVVWDYSR